MSRSYRKYPCYDKYGKSTPVFKRTANRIVRRYRGILHEKGNEYKKLYPLTYVNSVNDRKFQIFTKRHLYRWYQPLELDVFSYEEFGEATDYEGWWRLHFK